MFSLRNFKKFMQLNKMASNSISTTSPHSKKKSENSNGQFSFPIRQLKSISKQNYDYFLVLDFEATCDAEKTPQPQVCLTFKFLNNKSGE